uniref:Uncharacterized protein n=1 Tax=Anguilla anguilla TaxID=7936 RepID=A0A0E9X875_ANGAN
MAAPFSQQLHLAQQKQNYTNKKMTTPFFSCFSGFCTFKRNFVEHISCKMTYITVHTTQ